MTETAKKHSAVALPWRALMCAGIGRLGLAPSVFWGMTLQELDAALDGAPGGRTDNALVRDDLMSLMALYPDV